MDSQSRREIEELTDVDWTQFGDEFLLDNRARLSPVAHIAEVRRLFDDLIACARGGDRVAAKRLLRVANRLEQSSLAAFATSKEHFLDVRRIQEAIAEFGEGDTSHPE